ncbi:MAG: TRAP transporter small permease [Aestuariibacter sp.]|nr:TRAP transporter small permease [Aestuariibacter sp.]
MQTITRISKILAIAGAFAYFVIGLMLCYEVVARYLFNAPTIWAAELSQLFLVWGTFVSVAAILHRREHITITLLTERFSPAIRRVQETAVLLAIALLAFAVVWYGTPIAWDSLERGRTTGSMLNIPTFWMEAAVPTGFALLGMQALVEALRTAYHGSRNMHSQPQQSK